ncbi:hypothetical protein N7457_008201 [Penicillium paradoxum]|uniref:uncharacterized protein n=1 Tax=Penicillium paradoxum TaxID=176176 RepID=UPI002549B826|nr:uncharacterized protein N7457_008201 [Penicillium paradoxum]KAJ5773305.1 hypothetical protein N7457_008201 [Penicillium paradoxum]
MALEDLPTEILLLILESLSSPVDLLSATRASPVLHCTFITYKKHLLRHNLLQAIHPACRADVYSALDAQSIPKLITSGESLARIKSEGFSFFARDRGRRGSSGYQFKLDDEQVETLFRLHVGIERLIDCYCQWSLGNLQAHQVKPTQFDANAVYPRADLSTTERVRLQRAFYRCDIHARFRQVLHLLSDNSSSLSYAQSVLSFVSQFAFHEFEEIFCVKQFLAQYVRSLCERVEDDFIASFSPNALPGRGTKRQSAYKPPQTKNLYPDELSFFTNKYRESQHADHVKFITSYGLSYLLHLNQLGPRALKYAILESYADSLKDTVTDFINTCGLLIESCDKEERDTVLRGRLVSIPGDLVSSINLGWKWATSFEEFPRPNSPAMFDLRNRGYVFWDQGRLQASGLVNEPVRVCIAAYYFPPGHEEPFLRPSVEDRFAGFELDHKALTEWKDE